MVKYTDPGPVEFSARLERADVSNGQAYVVFPFSVPDLFGTKGRVPVTAQFDGVDYQGSLVTYGNGHLIPVLRHIREQIGKRPGDVVQVRIALDTADRVVELADDVASALQDSGQLAAFRQLSYSHQREYQVWIAEAKRPETRATRIAKTSLMVREGKRAR
jgi:hypothetical protein